MPISSAMRRALGVAAVLSCLMSIGLGSARAERIVAAGYSVSLFTASSIDQVCHSEGAVAVNVIEPPRGGFLEIVQTKAYPNFNALNTRSRCNTRKLPATQVVYQSAGDFLGPDSVTLELIFPGGTARRVRVPITVRPATVVLAPAPPPGAEALTPQAPAPQSPSSQPLVPLAGFPIVPGRPKRVAHHRVGAVAALSRHHPCQAPCTTPRRQGRRPSATGAGAEDPTGQHLIAPPSRRARYDSVG